MDIPLFDKFLYSYVLMIDENTIITSSYNGDVNGLRLTTDQGKNWREIDSEFPPLTEKLNKYSLLGIIGNEVYIKLGFNTVGVNIEQIYRTTFDQLGITTGVETEQNTLVTSPPYPQPARTAVTIEYGDYILSMKDIAIYNLEGREIKNQVITINNNSITWDCSAVQAGIYLINIKHGTEEKAVKVVVE